MLCTRTPDSFEAVRAERLKISGKPSQYDDLSAFVAEQNRFLEPAGHSLLPMLKVDVSDYNVYQAVKKKADWSDTSGGLYMVS